MNTSQSLKQLNNEPGDKKGKGSKISIIKKNFKNSFGFMKDGSKGNLKSTTTIEDNISGDQSKLARNFDDFYEELELIGEGSHAIVKKAKNKADDSLRAVKITRTSDPEIIIACRNEYFNSLCLDHPNIVKIYDMFIDELKGKSYYVMEFLPFKSLDYHLRKKSGGFSETETINIVIQILQSLDYMHKRGICHRDIKPKNILVDLQNDFKLKVIDFGISKNFLIYSFKNGKTSKTSRRMYTCTGSIFYCAPEVFNGDGYNHLVDVWSVGIITYELLTGKLPFHSEYVCETIELINKQSLEFPEMELSSLAKDFMRRLLNRNTEQRISASEALLHPFLSPSVYKTPPKSIRKNFSPEATKKYLTQTRMLPKEFMSAHKMTMNFLGSNGADFKIMRLDSSFEAEEENKREEIPEFLAKTKRQGKGNDFIENFQLRKEILNKKEGLLEKREGYIHMRPFKKANKD